MYATFKNRNNLCLLVGIICAITLWWVGHKAKPEWPGVPPIPTQTGLTALTLGDPQFSYRFSGLTLQNIGDTGGRNLPLGVYNYSDLAKWFWLLREFDPKSDHTPLIAAYYFGASRNPDDLRHIIDYLAVVGDSPTGEKWRWLAQAVFLARHRVNDLERSLELAYKLADLGSINPDMPIWARQMPSFVLTAMGENDAARALIEAMLATEHNLPGYEINFLKAYLTEELGVPTDIYKRERNATQNNNAK